MAIHNPAWRSLAASELRVRGRAWTTRPEGKCFEARRLTWRILHISHRCASLILRSQTFLGFHTWPNMSNKTLPQPFGETAQSARASRPFRRQYPSADLSNEQSQLMSDGIQSAAQHGVPMYTSSAADRYTPYGQDQQDDSKGFKTIDLDSYAVPGSTDEKQPMRFMDEKKTLRQKHPILFKTIQAAACFFIIAFLLTIPILVTFDARETTEDDAKSRIRKNLVFWIFITLLANWAFVGVFYIIAMLFPYIFRLVAHYVNPAHERYWRVFIMMRSPIVILFGVIGSYITVFTVSGHTKSR